MQKSFSFSDWLEHVRYLMPISGVVHVGAGGGMDALQYATWAVPQAVLIEADETLAGRLTAAIEDHPAWSAHTAFISDGDRRATFHIASNPNESGSIKPESLAKFWRNLRTIEELAISTTTLDVVLNGAAASEVVNWAIVDCLPALPVLRGAARFITRADVIVARVILDEEQLPDEGGGKYELDRFLETHGYRCLATDEENQPALGRALYVRDWKASCGSDQTNHRSELLKVVAARDEQAKLAADRQAQIQQLTQARDEQAKLSSEAQAQLAQFTQARDEQAKLAADRQAQIQKLTQARDEQAKLSSEAQAQFAQLTQACDEQAKLAADRQAQIQKLTQARDEQAKLSSEAQAQFAQLPRRGRATNSQQTGRLRSADTSTEMNAKLSSGTAQLAQLTQARDQQAPLAARLPQSS
ncbi:MAG: hypothetical protein IPL11_03900 [Candidatus Accumulibacter sp.]|nr:hypothetical protein [Accumulibacter sp.]